MTEIVTTYGQLVSFLASIFGVSGALVALVLYWRNKKSKLVEDRHRLMVEKRSFEINNLAGLVELGLYSDKDSVSLETLKSIYNDSEKSEVIKNKYAGSYDCLYKIVSLSREINDGVLQTRLAFWFFVLVITSISLVILVYEPN